MTITSQYFRIYLSLISSTPTLNKQLKTNPKMATHQAAMSSSPGQPLTIQSRPTPMPGPNELLIAVKSVALNPADVYMRDMGLFIPSKMYPTVVGFDVAGLVLEIGANVPTDTFHPGVTRIAALTASFWRSCEPNYGAFQEQCLVPWQHAVPLPDDGKLSWNHAATLSVAAEVALCAWDVMGISMPGIGSTGKGGKREALLVWGASSSVGTMGIQTARILREDPHSSVAAVYATAGLANQGYIVSLGADRVFDYKDSRVVDAIVSAAKEDRVVIKHCFLANGKLEMCQDVLKAFLSGDGEDSMAKIASAPVVPGDAEVVGGIETIFALPSAVEEERLEQFRSWVGTWLRENLATGNIQPSPEPRVVGRGLEAIDAGLDILRSGVSCTKLVIEVSE